MSQFDFPRVNFTGGFMFNPNTANNDDYSANGLRLNDSINVQPAYKELTDEEFMTFATTIQTLPDESQEVPGEWNYFGDMAFSFTNVTINAIQTGVNEFSTNSDLLGASLTLYPAAMIDVNPEDASCSQIFCENIALANNGTTYFSGKPTKACTRWINFFSNINTQANAGASAVFYFVLKNDQLAGAPILQDPLFKNIQGLQGLKIRFTVYLALTAVNGAQGYANLYENYAQKTLAELKNPVNGIVVGTISPWFEDEMESITLARILNPDNSFKNPNFPNGGNGPSFVLGPTLAKISDDKSYISLDTINTYPNKYDSTTKAVSKFDMGISTLSVTLNGTTADIGQIDYNDYDTYLKCAGLVDIPLSGLPASTLEMLEGGSLSVTAANYSGTLLLETDFMIASDQACVYANQNDPVGQYISQGVPEPVVVQAYYKGNPVDHGYPLRAIVYEYSMTPINQVGYTGYSQFITIPNPGGGPTTLNLSTQNRGCFLYLMMEVGTLSPAAPPQAPDEGAGFFVNMRCLPTDDYSDYISGKIPLTWQVLYEKVLRNYKLIYPAMNMIFPFEESYWQNSAAMLYERTSAENWFDIEYMPRTRDLSDSRRQLIQTWLKKFMPTT